MTKAATGRVTPSAQAFAFNWPKRWLREQRGGYGFIQRIPCRVLEATPGGRLKILVHRENEGDVVRYVHPEKVVDA